MHDAAAQILGVDTYIMKMEKSQHGKPYFPNCPQLQFNISHSGEYAAAAICSCPVGVDVQTVRPIKDSLIAKLCRNGEDNYVGSQPDRSRAFIRLWTLKESYIKATGEGMSFPMDEMNFRIDGFCGELSGRISNQEGAFYLRDFGEFSLAACVLDGVKNGGSAAMPSFVLHMDECVL